MYKEKRLLVRLSIEIMDVNYNADTRLCTSSPPPVAPLTKLERARKLFVRGVLVNTSIATFL